MIKILLNPLKKWKDNKSKKEYNYKSYFLSNIPYNKCIWVIKLLLFAHLLKRKANNLEVYGSRNHFLLI
jgi:hypothetical protein